MPAEKTAKAPLQDSGADGSGTDGDGSAEHVLDGRGAGNDDVGRAGRGHDGHGPGAGAGRGRRGGLNGDLLNGGYQQSTLLQKREIERRLTVTIVQGQSVTTRWVGSVTV